MLGQQLGCNCCNSCGRAEIRRWDFTCNCIKSAHEECESLEPKPCILEIFRTPNYGKKSGKTCTKFNCEIETSLYFRPFSLLDGGAKLFPLQRGLDKVYTSLRSYLNPPNKAYMRLLWRLAPCAGPLHEDGFIPSALQIIHSVYFLWADCWEPHGSCQHRAARLWRRGLACAMSQLPSSSVHPKLFFLLFLNTNDSPFHPGAS